ncbi:MAG: protease pro-enzyme activation domain-containing protein [Terriglobales bacterium]
MRRSPSAFLPSSNFSTSNLTTLILCVLLLSTLSLGAVPDRIAGAIDSNHTFALTKSHHPKAQPQFDRGPVDPSFKLGYVTLMIAPSAAQQKALDQLLAQQQNPHSALYHQWLTPQQFAALFGLSQNDLGKLTTWLTSQGFQILKIGGGRNEVIVSGTAAQAERAFGTEIHNYEVNGVEHFANSGPVKLPAALHGVVAGVMGLHDFRAIPAARFRAQKPRPAYYDQDFIWPNFLAPGDFTTIYDLGPLYTAGYDGTNQTLAIVGQTDVYLSDLNDFRSGFGLSTITCTAPNDLITACSDPHFSYVLNGPDPGPVSGDLGEADLDLEWSGAVAYNAQVIYVNSGGTSGGVYDALSVVINPPDGPPLSKVVSMSYGYCEAFFSGTLEPLLSQGVAEGVTIINSAGDQSSAGCDYDPPNANPPFSPAQYGLAVSYPASSQYVTGVGGTEISLANDSYPSQSSYWAAPNTNPTNGGTANSYIPEISWNDLEEFANYCHAPAEGDTFCSTGGGTLDWVALPTTATAAQVQADLWLDGGGGGASNCWYIDPNTGYCLGAGAGPNGGGFAAPSYQAGLSVPSAPAGVRYVPDVSLLSSPNFPGHIWCTQLSELGDSGTGSSCASGIFDAVDTYFSTVGGTSAAAPTFAGIVALLNQYVVAKGIQTTSGLGNINPTLYQLALSNSTNKVFNQTTAGDNIVYCQPNTPANEPVGIVCPSGGSIGYQVSNADPNTGYNLVTGLGSVDANNLALALAGVGSATNTTLTSSLNPANYGAPVTFTATVTTTGSNQPTGTVTFLNGTTTLGTDTLSTVNSSQVATFTTSTLSGTDSITAAYGGDSSNAPSTSAVLTETINPPTFTFSSQPTTPTPVSAGENTTTTFTLTPGGGTFLASVSFSCSGLPDTTIICSATPIAAGATGPQTVTLTIITSGPNSNTGGSHQRRRADNRTPWLPLTLPLAGIVMVGLAGRKISRYSALAGLLASLALIGLMVACGGSSTPVSVSVSPEGATVFASAPTGSNWPPQTAAFTATVSNTTNTAVTWAVTTTNGGSITAGGVYTAPTAAEGLPGSATITATSQADTTKVATATVTITPTSVPGTYPIMVTATEGPTSVNSSSFNLTVQ